jgi:hypothetical protein
MATFDAGLLSAGWLSVVLASVKDKDRPILSNTVHVELYPDGVRLSATDSYVVLTCWVPHFADELAPEPAADEAPVARAIAMDPYGWAKGLFGHLLSLAREEDAEPIEVRLNIGLLPQDRSGSTLEFDGFEARWVIIEHPDHERVTLEVHEGDYPNWRKALGSFTAVKTAAVALNPEIVGRLAKLGKYHGDKPLVWRWGAESKAALVEVGHSFPFVSGAAMPVRWDFDRDAPRSETPAAGADDEPPDPAAAVTDYVEEHADEISADLSKKAGMNVTVTTSRGKR